MRRFLVVSVGVLAALTILGVAAIYKLTPSTSVESIGYQYAIRDDISNLPSLATPAGYTSLNPQSFFSGRQRIEKLAQSIVSGQSTELGKATALINWVQLHVRPQTSAPTTVITDDYVNIIKRGWGFCDQMAHVFATMATYVGLEATQLQLFKNDGVSPHTLAMVKIDGKWRIASTWRGVIPLNFKGEPYTLSGFINRLEKKDAFEFAPSGITAQEFKNSKTFSTFPYVSNIVVLEKFSIRVVQKLKSFNDSSNTPETFKSPPTAELQAKVDISHKDLVLYNKARDAHINMNYLLAEDLYSKVISMTMSDVLRDEARFQEGMAYFDAKEYQNALVKFENIVNSKGESAWKISAKRMTAETFVNLGQRQKALSILDTIDTVQSKVRAQLLRSRSVS